MSYEIRRQRAAFTRMKPTDGYSSKSTSAVRRDDGIQFSNGVDHSTERTAFIPENGQVKAASKFALRPLRRLTVELALVILAKLAFLMLIWWLIFAPHPKPDASADAIARRLAPSSAQPEMNP